MRGHPHAQAAKTIQQAQTHVKVWNVAGALAVDLGYSGEVSPNGDGDLASAARHPETTAAAHWRVGVQLGKHDGRV